IVTSSSCRFLLLLLTRLPPLPPLFPYTTLFRSLLFFIVYAPPLRALLDKRYFFRYTTSAGCRMYIGLFRLCMRLFFILFYLFRYFFLRLAIWLNCACFAFMSSFVNWMYLRVLFFSSC